MESVVLATQELMPSRNGDEEKSLSVAIKDVRIVKSSIEDLKAVLRYCMLKVGLRAINLPNEEEKTILLNHVISEYGNHTLAEIRLAFDMAISGKFDLEHSQIICYENFSCLYFSGIMNTYRKWASQAYRHAITEPLPIQKKYSKLEIDMMYLEFVWKIKQKDFSKLLLPLKK